MNQDSDDSPLYRIRIAPRNSPLLRTSPVRAMCYLRGMRLFSRETWLADVLVLVGLAALGAAIWLWLGAPALLGYAGTALIVIGLTLAGMVKS